jgi:hypothetical protein
MSDKWIVEDASTQIARDPKTGHFYAVIVEMVADHAARDRNSAKRSSRICAMRETNTAPTLSRAWLATIPPRCSGSSDR